MASTYSTSLRLELMATGDQSGTWGTTTNTNLGTLLEQAITGVLSVAQGDVANFTPTSLNGATDQARNAVINLTGAMTAARNMVVPTANKLYLVKNSTTGGFSVTVKTSAGTGVLIPPGTARWVYADGTNVVDGLTGNQAANAFLAGYTTTTTAAGTTVLTVASTQTQYFTGATTQTITLPVTSTLVLGQEYEIVNNSTGSLTVNSSGANLVATVLAGNTVRVQVVLLSGTSAASWNAIAASVPNPLTLSGSTVGYTPLVLTSTEAAAAAGPIQDIYRDSASPAANDILGQLLFNGRDSAANKQEYASIQALIISPTSTTETGALDIYTTIAGARTKTMSVGPNTPNTPTQMVEGLATTATAAGTTTLVVGSAKNQVFTGSTTQTVVLPVASTLPQTGWQIRIINQSTGTVTVNSSGGNQVALVPPGATALVTAVLTSATDATSWATMVGGVGLLPAQSLSGLSTATFTGLSPNAKVVYIGISGLTFSATSNLLVQIGTSGGFVTTGYAGATSVNATTGGSSTAGFVSYGETANTYNVTMVLTLANPATDLWNSFSVFTNSSGTQGGTANSSLALGGDITQLRITTVGGTATFTGNAGVSYLT